MALAPATASAATRAADASTSSGLGNVVSRLAKTSNATFSATYNVVVAKTGQDQSITFAQAPPKFVVHTPKGSFYLSSTTVMECSGTGTVTCTKLPTAILGPVVDPLKALYDPGVIVDSLRGIEGIMAAHQAGVNVSTSSGTYNHLSSTCVTLTGKKFPTPATYCAADSTGVMDHVQAYGSTVTLTAYTTHPPASTFAPPAGAKIISIPKL